MQKIAENGHSGNFEPRSQGNQDTYTRNFDVNGKNWIKGCYQNNFMKKYLKLAEISSINLKFQIFYALLQEITWQTPARDRPPGPMKLQKWF